MKAKEELKSTLGKCQWAAISRTEKCVLTTRPLTWHKFYTKSNMRITTSNRYELILKCYTIPRISNLKLKN